MNTVVMTRRDGSGEGSKGGKVIGHTESGKAIYMSHGHPSHANFTKEDHEFAAFLHGEMTKTGSGKVSTTNKSKLHAEQRLAHLKSAGGK